jgi:hypothetical protein
LRAVWPMVLQMVCSIIFRNARGVGMRVWKRWRNYNEGVMQTDKHNCVDLIYWSFIKYCYMFRPFTSAFIGQASDDKRSGKGKASPNKLFFSLSLSLSGSAAQRGLWPPRSRGFRYHTQRRATVVRTPLNEWSAGRRDPYLTTHKTDKHPCPRWDSNPLS